MWIYLWRNYTLATQSVNLLQVSSEYSFLIIICTQPRTFNTRSSGSQISLFWVPVLVLVAIGKKKTPLSMKTLPCFETNR